jgi:hypothetical protein
MQTQIFLTVLHSRLNELSKGHCTASRRAINLEFERSSAKSISPGIAGDSSGKKFESFSLHLFHGTILMKF